MKTISTIQTVGIAASTLALALGLGLATAAKAGDFEDNYPGFTEARDNPGKAASDRVVSAATTPKRNPRESVSTEESRAMLGEDSGSFWLSRQWYAPQPSAVARSITR